MIQARLGAVTRVLSFYLVAMLLLLLVGGQLQHSLGIPGVIATHLLIFFGLPLFFTTNVDRKPVRPFLRLRALSARGVGKAVALGVSGWFMVTAMGSLVTLLVRWLGGEMVETYSIFFTGPVWLTLLAGALVPALCEEISFRGYVLGALRPLGATAGIVLTGLLFGALHLSLLRLIPLSLLGILWAMAAQRSGSILPGMITHFLNNAISLGLTIFVQNPANPAQPEGFDPGSLASGTGLILVLVAVAAGFAVLSFFIAGSFSRKDLANPAAAAAEEDALTAAPRVTGDALPFGEEASAEVRELQQELTKIRARRQWLQAAGSLLIGLIILGIYLWATVQELVLTFPG